MNQANGRYCDIKMLITSLPNFVSPTKLKKKSTKPPTVQKLTGKVCPKCAVLTWQRCCLWEARPESRDAGWWLSGIKS